MATSNICQNLPKYECSQATTPSGRNNKAGWYDIHEKHSKLARFSQSSSVILCGDSIVAGLSRYPKVWNRFFKPWKALNFGIGGDRTQHVLWRAEHIKLPATTKIAVIHCGTNNIEQDQPWDIANGIISIGLAFQEKRPGIKVIVTGLLPRDFDWSYRRDKIIKTNIYLEKLCCTKMKDFFYMRQDSDWTLEGGELNSNLYHTDCLHLIETGNEKFAKSIANVLYRVIEGREIDYPSDESDFIRPAPYVAPCPVSCVTPRPVLCSVSMSRNVICPNTLPLNKGVNSPKPKWEKCWYVHCPPVPLSPARVSKHVSKTISSSVHKRVRKPVSKPISSSVCKCICKPVSTCVRNCVDTVPRSHASKFVRPQATSITSTKILYTVLTFSLLIFLTFYTSNIYNFNNTFFNSTFTNLFFNSGNSLLSFNLTFTNLFFKTLRKLCIIY